nr:hypothetical protein [Tanacetum cinerariifolium]
MNTKEHDKRQRSRRSRTSRTNVFSKIRGERSRSLIRRERSRSPRQMAKEGGVFKRLGSRGKSVSARSDSYHQQSHSRYTKALSESEDSGGGHQKSSGEEDDLSQPWVCEETNPFTPRIRYFDFPKTRMPSHIKTYDGSEDPQDHLKIFQAAAKTERWAMPTWCHKFNSTLTGNARVWFDDLPPESIDTYHDLKKAFLKNYLQQKKYIKDPIELHNIKQRNRESTKDFVRRYNLENRDVKGVPECMRISGFVHGITNLELIKRFHDKIPIMVDEMMRVTTSSLRGEVAASNHEQKKSFPPWKQHEGNHKQNFKKEVFEANNGHNTDECMQLRKKLKEMLQAEKLLHLIKEIKQNNGKEQPKVTNKGEFSGKDKALAILMMNFMVVRSQSSYNGIIGRPGVRKLQAVPSTAHEMLKIPVEGGVITLKSSKLVPLECAMVSGPRETPSAGKPIIEERVKVAINPKYPDQIVMIGSTLIEGGCNKLFPFKCFLDAYKGYHQIQMATEDEDKTAFITSQGIFCYTKMPFGLRNAGATYQHLVDKVFHKQIGKNLEVYVDDLVIKSRTKEEIARDVEEIFKTLREINMKLNLKNCAFGVEEGMFLGALRGPELNYTSMEKLVLALVHASKRLKNPRVFVKGLILADFIVERPEEDSPDTPMEEEGELFEPWILFTDGSSCTDDSGAGLILTNPEGMKFTYALRFRFYATNNEAEYEALIAELRIAEQMGVKNLKANVDSRLVANQVNGTYAAKESDMIRYLKKVKAFIGSFKAFSIKQIPRRTLPADVKKARSIKWKYWQFFVVSETLYKKSFLGLWLRCVGPQQANYVLREIHEGSCSMHADTRSVMAKALRTGYYWHTIHRDARTLIRACQDCQVHEPVLRNPQFRLPGEIISDNGKKFRDDPFKDWCEKLRIRQHFASVKHSETNGLVERANRSLGEEIKARLDERSKNWIEELPYVLWAHRTMIKSSNEDTPFSLTYGMEEVILIEIGMPTLRTAEVDMAGNNEALEINLDLL